MFTKKDLKNVCVCVTASKKVFIAFPEANSLIYGSSSSVGGSVPLYNYTDDLKSRLDMKDNINKIYRPSNLEQISFNPAIYGKGTLVFDREAEEKKANEEKFDKPTYKAGDKVEIIGNSNCHHFTIGEIVTLYSSFGDGYWRAAGKDIFCSNGAWCVKESDIKPYNKAVVAKKHIKVVFVTQNDKDYLFEVPSDLDLKKGDKVLCKTMRGLQEGVCRMDSTIMTDGGLEALAKMCGAYLPLKKVASKVPDAPKPEKFVPHLESSGENRGKIGTPTKYKDALDRPLVVGDVIELYKDGELRDEYPVVQEGKTQFVMGIMCCCDSATGEISDDYKILKKRSHAEVKNGEVVGFIEYIKE